MDNPYFKNNIKIQLINLNKGLESGLSFFYKKFYAFFYLRSRRATQDTCIADSITQEAFLRLWLFRENVNSEEDIFHFLKTQVRSAVHIYYSKSRNRFHRSLLQLDAIENYQEFIGGYEAEEEPDEDVLYLERLAADKTEKLNKLKLVLPFLNIEQQRFIKLCLLYSFNYERIAYYLGGISDYEVSIQVEKTIDILRSIFNSSEKMSLVKTNTKILVEGEFTNEQMEIFRMRYELQLSFEQISQQLNLNASIVKQRFIEAHRRIKPNKRTA